jgi:Beta-lactamase class C and other penicillin binding proteins
MAKAKTMAKTTVLMLTALIVATANAELTPSQVEDKIRCYMDENKTVGMAVVMVNGDKVVYQKAFGYRDKDTREPLDINDIFRIASISKSFSGVSVMQLVEAGKMSLDDDINNILGMDIRNPRYPDVPVTVKMLLSHTSGMKDGGGGNMYRDLTYVDKSKTDLETIRDKAWLPYPPGKGYNYCNRALNIIGLVIEKVSGERFDEYVLNHILKPIGADNAGFNLDSLDKSAVTQLYSYSKKSDCLVPGGGYVRVNELKVANGTYKIGKDGCYWSPTGGMKMSAPNLAKWMMTLRDGGVAPNGNRVLSEAGCRKLLTPVITGDPGTQYCLTTRVETRFIEGKTLKGHTGSAHGLFSCMYFCPDEGWGFVCLCSSAKPDKVNGIRKCYYQIINLLYDQHIKPNRQQPSPVKVSK